MRCPRLYISNLPVILLPGKLYPESEVEHLSNCLILLPLADTEHQFNVFRILRSWYRVLPRGVSHMFSFKRLSEQVMAANKIVSNVKNLRV